MELARQAAVARPQHARVVESHVTHPGRCLTFIVRTISGGMRHVLRASVRLAARS